MKDKSLTCFAIRDIFLFVAELNGYKAGTVTGKYRFGAQCYLEHTLPSADTTTEEGRKDLHEIIWLERIYKALDAQSAMPLPLVNILKRKGDIKSLLRNLDLSKSWDVPIELDASASMLGYIGCLLGDARLLEETNMHGTALSDPWQRGMNRTMFKHAATPLLYGSSRSCENLWKSKKHKYTDKDVTLFINELNRGSLGVAVALKDLIISYCKLQPEMAINVAGEKFNIECNRYRNVGEETKTYTIYDSVDRLLRTIHHTTTKKVPDLEQFRRFTVTCLIHNLDSQVANKVTQSVIERYGWCLDIHDAFLVHPSAAKYCRARYAQEMQCIYDNRKQILADYFASIGIGPEAQASWNALQAKVVPVTNFKCRPTVLK